jgi:hypothetical protein
MSLPRHFRYLSQLLRADDSPPPRTERLHHEMVVPASVADTFAFFADAGNLQRITPPWLHVSIPTAVPLASNRTFPQERLNKEIRRICVLTQINS